MAMYLSNIYYIRGTVYIYEGAPFQGETAIVRLNDPFMWVELDPKGFPFGIIGGFVKYLGHPMEWVISGFSSRSCKDYEKVGPM